MIEELQAAGNLLCAALERYTAACSAVATCYDPADAHEGISRIILNLIPDQLELISAYETKFKQAKATINRLRNASSAIVPVNALSPDILAYVFQLVLNEQPGFFEDIWKLKQFPLRYPETLSHICWRWRQIAISSRILWSRIDVVSLLPRRSRRLLARAKVFTARTDSSPLDIHFIGRPLENAPKADPVLNAFCASVATRIRSLNMSCSTFEKHHFPVLQTCFENRGPGKLDEILMDVSLVRHSDGTASSRAKDRFLDTSDTCIKDGLLSVRVLRLAGMYFNWTSQAYHGLVELYLIGGRAEIVGRSEISITQLQFMEILSKSPRLRVLRFGLEIVDPLPRDTPHAAISLDDLEVLDLLGIRWAQSKIVVGLLSLGSKPLQLSFNIGPTAQSLYEDEFPSFVARSNIEKLHLESDHNTPGRPLFELCRFPHIPSLRTLSLVTFDFCSTSSVPRSQSLDHKPHSFPVSQLDVLRFTRCTIDPDDLREISEVLRIQKLKLTDCYEDSRRFYPVSEYSFADAKIPVVELVPGPILRGFWGPLDWYLS